MSLRVRIKSAVKITNGAQNRPMVLPSTAVPLMIVFSDDSTALLASNLVRSRSQRNRGKVTAC
jgi:hypothetical protein